MRLLLWIFSVAVTQPLLCRAQLGLVCRGSDIATKLFSTLVEALKPWLRLNSPVRVPGLDENFGLARLYKCKMDGLTRAEFTAPIEVDCNDERVLLGLTVGLNNTDIACELVLGMAPALAVHTTLSFHLERLIVYTVLQLPRNRKSKAKVALLKTEAKSVVNPKLIMTGLEPVTSLLSQAATLGLRVTPLFTRAFFTAFLGVEAPKILKKVSLPF